MRIAITRRDFLRRVARLGLVASGAGLFWSVAGCAREQAQVATSTQAQSTATAVPRPASTVAAPVSSTPQPAPTVAAATPVPSATSVVGASPAPTATQVGGTADLSVAQGSNFQEITRAAVQAIGGIERFVPRGSKVVIKPNICVARTPEYAVTTHPEIVAALVKLCREAGAAKVTVLDFGFGGLNSGYKESGIEEAVKQSGGSMERISMMKFKKLDVPRGKEMKQLAVYQDVLDADVIIDAPIAKHHSLAGLTLGMKNMMGVTNDREIFHRNIGQRVADLCTVARPTVTVIDATRILLRNGPTGGNLNDVKKLETVIASADVVAADSYAATLFGQTGQALPTARAGQEMGLGTWDLSALRIAKLTV